MKSLRTLFILVGNNEIKEARPTFSGLASNVDIEQDTVYLMEETIEVTYTEIDKDTLKEMVDDDYFLTEESA